jgi:pilus assembly protein FimV
LSDDQTTAVPAVADEAADAAAQDAESTSDEENLLDFDLDFAIDSENAAGAAPASLDQEPALTDDDPDHSVDFDFAVLPDEEKPNALDFEFDSSQFDIATDEALASGVVTAAEDDFDDLQFVDDSLLAEKSESEEESGDDDVLEFLADSDEAATKLDLARAYYEMGDYDGAREILDEVVNEGNEEQVKDAQRLLAKI